MKEKPAKLCPLADSLPATIRWRFVDYEHLLTKQLKLLATVSQAPRAARFRQVRH